MLSVANNTSMLSVFSPSVVMLNAVTPVKVHFKFEVYLTIRIYASSSIVLAGDISLYRGVIYNCKKFMVQGAAVACTINM